MPETRHGKGACSTCGFRIALTAAGMVRKHLALRARAAVSGSTVLPSERVEARCPGSGKTPRA